MQELIAIIITVLILCLITIPFAVVFIGARHLANQWKKIGDAADKYLQSK
jgi:hypothetical protein